MNLLSELTIGGAVIGATVIIHTMTMDIIMKHAVALYKSLRRIFGELAKPAFAGIVVLTLFAAHIMNIWLWASLYLFLGADPVHDLSDALYFSTVTYTTAGYGDIVLIKDFRMLSGIEAANGMLLFGWTTAFIFEIISKIYRREADNL